MYLQKDSPTKCRIQAKKKARKIGGSERTRAVDCNGAMGVASGESRSMISAGEFRLHGALNALRGVSMLKHVPESG